MIFQIEFQRFKKNIKIFFMVNLFNQKMDLKKLYILVYFVINKKINSVNMN